MLSPWGGVKIGKENFLFWKDMTVYYILQKIYKQAIRIIKD